MVLGRGKQWKKQKIIGLVRQARRKGNSRHKGGKCQFKRERERERE